MITSLQNDRIKQIRALQSKRHARRKAGLMVIEGQNLIRDALLTEIRISDIYYVDDFASGDKLTFLQEVGQSGASLIPVSDEVMKSISDTQNPSGILALVPLPEIDAPDDLSSVLIIDGIADPGNMGSIMRTAAGAGIDAMIITAGTVDLTNPKVIRSGMGAHFRLPVLQYSWEGLANLFDEHAIFLADSAGGAPYYQIDWTQKSALIISDEAHGASDEARRFAHAQVSIPLERDVESLNVGAAAGIILFEMLRQRTLQQA